MKCHPAAKDGVIRSSQAALWCRSENVGGEEAVEDLGSIGSCREPGSVGWLLRVDLVGVYEGRSIILGEMAVCRTWQRRGKQVVEKLPTSMQQAPLAIVSRGRMWRVVWVDLVDVGSYGDQGSSA